MSAFLNNLYCKRVAFSALILIGHTVAGFSFETGVFVFRRTKCGVAA